MAKLKKKRSKKYDQSKLEKLLDRQIEMARKTTLKERTMNLLKSIVKTATVVAVANAVAYAKPISAIAKAIKAKMDKNRHIVRSVRGFIGGYMIGFGFVGAILATTVAASLMHAAIVFFGIAILNRVAQEEVPDSAQVLAS